MKSSNAIIATLIAGAIVLSTPFTIPTPGTAQQTSTVAHARPLPRRHIEGRIAFMRAELSITDAQQAKWERVAAVMRANAEQMDQLVQLRRTKRGQPESAVDRLDQQMRWTEVRLNAERAFADAFKPLYASLSDDQKKSADGLFRWRGHGRSKG